MDISKSELEELYKNHTQKEIAAILGCSADRIFNLIKTYGLRKSVGPTPFECPSRDEIKHLYEEYCLNTKEIADRFGVSKSLVQKWMKNLEIKSRREVVLELPRLSRDQKDLVIGSLLGDAYLCSRNFGLSHFAKAQAQFDGDRDRKEYLEWHYLVMKGHSLSLRSYEPKGVMKFPGGHVGKKRPYHVFKTHTHEVYCKLEKHWYKRDANGNYVFNDIGRRIKVIPNNLTLNAARVAVWYCDDGTLTGGSLRLCTDCFTDEERDYLIYRLKKDINIKSKQYNGRIIIGVERHNFIDIVRPYIPWRCFSYKLNVGARPKGIMGENSRFAKLKEKQVLKCFELHKKGLKNKEIAIRLQIDRNHVSAILRGKIWKHLNLSSKSKLSLANTSGCRGVYWDKPRRKWVVKFNVNGKMQRFGAFIDKEDAIQCYNEAQLKKGTDERIR